MILCAGAGGYASVRLFETDGIYLSPEVQTPENILQHWEQLNDTKQQSEVVTGMLQSEKFLKKAKNYLESTLVK